MSKEGWTTVTLGDIAENISVRVDDPSKSGLDRFVGLVHLDSGSVTVSRWDSTDSVTSSMKQFQAGDVLLARRNAHLRRASAVDFEGVCSGDAYVLREKPDVIVPGLLKYILNTNRFWEYAIANADGSMSTRVKWKHLQSYSIILNSKTEQNQNLELLDAVNSCIDIGNQLHLDISQLIGIMCNHADNLSPKDSDFSEYIAIGPTNGIYKPGSSYSLEIGNSSVIRIESLSDWKIDANSTLKRNDLNSDEIEKYKLEHNDLIINRVHSIQYLGKSAVVIRPKGVVAAESNNFFLRLKDPSHALLIYMIINSSRFKKYVLSRAKKAVAQSSINQKDLRAFKCGIPEGNIVLKLQGCFQFLQELILLLERRIGCHLDIRNLLMRRLEVNL